MPGMIWTGLGVILAVAGALGVSYAVFRSTTVTKTVELYKGENEVQGKAIARQALQLVEQDARIAALERENEVLRNLVVGHDQLDLLVRDSAERHTEHIHQVEILADIKDLLQEMWRSVARTKAEES